MLILRHNDTISVTQQEERKMTKVLFLIIVISSACISAYAAEEKLGRDDFVSSSIAAVFDKVGQYTSGEKRILEKEEDTTVENKGQLTDAVGRKAAEPAITIRGSIPSGAKKPAEKATP